MKMEITPKIMFGIQTDIAGGMAPVSANVRNKGKE